MNTVHTNSPNGSFKDLVSKFSSVDHKLPKGMVIGYSERPRNVLVSLQRDGAQEVCGIRHNVPIAQRSACKETKEEENGGDGNTGA